MSWPDAILVAEGHFARKRWDSTTVKPCDTLQVIRSFRHRGLKRFYETGSKAGIQPEHAPRLRLQLTRLNAASVPADMNLSGWKFHPLAGSLDGHYAVTVNKNWRLTFMFRDCDAIVVDYQDYH